MINEPNTVPIPAPEPATPTVAAPAPMNLAAESMSLLTAEVWNPRSAGSNVGFCVFSCVLCTKLWLWVTTLLRGLMYVLEFEMIALRATGAINLAQANIFEV